MKRSKAKKLEWVWIVGTMSLVYGCTGLSLNTGASSRAELEAMIKGAAGSASGGGSVAVKSSKDGMLTVEAGGGSAQASADTKAAAEAASKAAATAEAVYKKVEQIAFWVILAACAALILNVSEIIKFAARIFSGTGV
jgi:DNA-binding Xre family transcriptional regulator